MDAFRHCAKNIALGLLSLGMLPSAALAAQPKPWQLGFQDAATDNMAQITSFNDFLLVLMAAITLIVLGLMVYVMLRFNAKTNPEPSKTTHNTLVEVVWTVVPILILVIIAIPSFRLLYYQRVLPEADMTIKATGYQWYWGYEYPDHGGFAFDSLMLNDDERGDQPRLLATDTAMVVPVNATVRVVVTGADVLHSWAMPAFGVKMDAVPGRLNETWFRAEQTGTFYGQCSELCGVRHAFMPIRVEVVEQEEFASWVEEAKAEYAQLETSQGMLAAASTLNE
ncbi:MAG: cytochrome c oxidase subunit II [Rhizobiales bacterium TMED143]|nr:cytochrome c oxidase subunit II [Rhodobiaceae bacterium]OUV93131.1 MAG: cytochrome c oxidase subunit II [Rhizobiales bacterium TMED143]CAI8392811.1 MAG: Cytochrome c oxidase subunit 2 [Rhodobiaceae bacterium UBA7378]HCQ82908.1 cytochrome c oxidase subunit II [Rhodobiaceae bacterium]|tara:strand:+ start:1279 stop:2121 length:843 start_codon:yes stop_codon:yes gene_type:complete